MARGQIQVHRCAWVDVACVPARRAVDQKSYDASCRILPATLDKCVVFNWLNDKDRIDVGVPGCRSEAEFGAKTAYCRDTTQIGQSHWTLQEGRRPISE